MQIEQDGRQVTVHTDEDLAQARRGWERRLAETEEQARAASAQVEALQAQVIHAQQAQQAADRLVHGVAALVDAGVPAGAARELLGLPSLADIDFTTPEGVQQAVERLTGLFPALIASATGPRITPLGGIGGTGGASPDPAGMSMADYIRYRHGS